MVENVPSLAAAEAPATAWVNDNLAVLYLSPEGRIAFRRGEESPQILDGGGERPGGKHLKLYYDERRLYALWWQKLENAGKHLYVRVSEDGGESFGPLTILNTGLGVLPVYELVTDGADRVAVIYYDERRPKYQIYLNRSLDGGKTWLAEDVRLDSKPFPPPGKKPAKSGRFSAGANPFAVDPHIVFHGDRLVAVWKERREDSKDHKPIHNVVSRVSKDGGATWESEVKILEGNPSFMISELLFSLGDQLVLVGYQNDEGLLAFRSQNGGDSWQPLGTLPGSVETKALSQTQGVIRGDELLLIYTYEQRKQPFQIHFAVLDLVAGQWRSETVRLDRKNFDATRSWNPDLALLKDGTVVAVWEDYDSIRPMVRMDISQDGGRTWLEAPRPLDVPGLYLLERPHLQTSDDGLFVFFDRWQDDSRKHRDYVYRYLPYDVQLDLSGLPEIKPISKEEKEKRLKQRAEEFWALRIQAKWAEGYDYYDPVFRSKFSRQDFLAQQGNVIFHSYEILRTLVWDNIGGLIVKVDFSVPEMFVEGKRISIDRREDTMHTEWVWIHDDWYVVYTTALRNKYLNYR